MQRVRRAVGDAGARGGVGHAAAVRDPPGARHDPRGLQRHPCDALGRDPRGDARVDQAREVDRLPARAREAAGHGLIGAHLAVNCRGDRRRVVHPAQGQDQFVARRLREQ